MPAPLPDAIREEIVRLYLTPLDDGTWVGSTTIARRLGTTTTTVHNTIQRAGFRVRNSRESHAHGKRCKPIVNVPTGIPPLCLCGCGNETVWNRREKRWRARIVGHRVPPPASLGRSRGRAGSLNGQWKGGVTPERQRLYRSAVWKQLVSSVFARDHYLCIRCGSPKRGKGSLHAHHVRPWAGHPELRMDLANLVTLCRVCHLWVHSNANTKGAYLRLAGQVVVEAAATVVAGPAGRGAADRDFVVCDVGRVSVDFRDVHGREATRVSRRRDALGA